MIKSAERKTWRNRDEQRLSRVPGMELPEEMI
jgi:hypothetical protein